MISGAQHIDAKKLARYFLNAHILRLKEAQLVQAGDAEGARVLVDGRNDVLGRAQPDEQTA